MDNRRTARVERALRDVLGLRLSSHYQSELKGFISVTRVEVTKDLRQAWVYFSVIGSNGDDRHDLAVLNKKAAELQSLIGRELPMRYCPRLNFVADHSYEQSMKVQEVLREEEKWQ